MSYICKDIVGLDLSLLKNDRRKKCEIGDRDIVLTMSLQNPIMPLAL